MAKCRKKPKRRKTCKPIIVKKVCRKGKVIRPKRKKALKFKPC